MQRAELKQIRQQALALREQAIWTGNTSAADTLDRLFRAHKAQQISAPQYAEQVKALAALWRREDAERQAEMQGCISADAASSQSAFSRKVAPAMREGYQTVRVGQRYEIRQDVAGNTTEQAIALFKTVRPKAAPVVSGAEAKKSRRVDAQRAQRAERQRLAQRAQRQAERAALTAEAERRAAAHTVKPETAEQREQRIAYAEGREAAAIARISPSNTPDGSAAPNPFVLIHRRRIQAERAAAEQG